MERAGKSGNRVNGENQTNSAGFAGAATQSEHTPASHQRTSEIFVRWQKIADAIALDGSRDCVPITANQLKDYSGGYEPRLLAKMDHLSDVPPVLADNGYFLLPVRNGEYVIVRGEGYHRLEPPPEPARPFASRLAFPLISSTHRTSEAQYIDYAINSGLLAAVLDNSRLVPSIGGRERTTPFSFHVNQSLLTVDGVQIEVDRGLEGPDSIVLLEAKSQKQSDFVIRQLFYPYCHYRHIAPNKKIIPVFFAYWPQSHRYNFWIYRFLSEKNYNSIDLVEQHSYTIVEPVGLEAIQAQGIMPPTRRTLIPQANDLNKVIELAFLVRDGVDTYQAVADYFHFAPRQSSYYREAAEAIGLVSLHGGKYTLTDTGHTLVHLPGDKRRIFFADLLLDFHLVAAGIAHIQKHGTLGMPDFVALIAETDKVHGTTVGRRANSLAAWFRWLSQALGIVTWDGHVFRLAGHP